MEIIILFVVISIISNILTGGIKKNQQNQKSQPKPPSAKPGSFWDFPDASKAFPNRNVRPPVNRPASVSLNSKPAQSMEGPVSAKPMAPTLKTLTATKQHTVKPFTESKHGHTESSMTGFEPCLSEPEAVIEPASSTSASKKQASIKGIPLNGNAVMMGVLYSEILGKPKALR